MSFTSFSIGDTVLCPLRSEGKMPLQETVGVIINIETSEIAIVNAFGHIHFYHPTELKVLMGYRLLLQRLTQQGVDLVERVTAR